MMPGLFFIGLACFLVIVLIEGKGKAYHAKIDWRWVGGATLTVFSLISLAYFAGVASASSG